MLVFLVTISEWVSLVAFTVYLVYQHAHKQVSLLVKAFTFIGWFMGLSIIAILPLDILIVSKVLEKRSNYSLTIDLKQ